KAHSAAFGLLAYQSTWLRVHFAAEFLCALMNEQPMGFYPPDTLVHEAQRRGIAILPPDTGASIAECRVEGGAVRMGLGYVNGVSGEDVKAIVAERERGGPFASVESLASRCATRVDALERLAWAGALDALVGDGRREALWRLGPAAAGHGARHHVHAAGGRARHHQPDRPRAGLRALQACGASGAAAGRGWEARAAGGHHQRPLQLGAAARTARPAARRGASHRAAARLVERRGGRRPARGRACRPQLREARM